MCITLNLHKGEGWKYDKLLSTQGGKAGWVLKAGSWPTVWWLWGWGVGGGERGYRGINGDGKKKIKEQK